MNDGEQAKQPLCYACGLRMSMLFQHTPPPTLKQLLHTRDTDNLRATSFLADDSRPARDEHRCANCIPIQDHTHHSRFVIIHETQTSAQRYFGWQRRSLYRSDGRNDRADCAPADNNSTNTNCVTVQGNSFCPCHTTSCSPQLLCVACLGLYQFMDHIHAPAIAVAVRRSPYRDSTGVSININVSRAFTFTWLAAATRYFGNRNRQLKTNMICPNISSASVDVEHGGNQDIPRRTHCAESNSDCQQSHRRVCSVFINVPDAEMDRPAPEAVVPEELSNFKELYMRDLRARVLQYLCVPHEHVVAALDSCSRSHVHTHLSSPPSAASRSSDDVSASHALNDSTSLISGSSCSLLSHSFHLSPLGNRTYQTLLQASSDDTCVAAASSNNVCKSRCIRFSRERTQEESEKGAMSRPHKILRLGDEGRGSHTSLLCHDTTAAVEAVHVEQALVYNNENTSIIVDVHCQHPIAEELTTSEYLPKQYCSNRSECVLTYGVIYDYVLPFLQRKRLGCGADEQQQLQPQLQRGDDDIHVVASSTSTQCSPRASSSLTHNTFQSVSCIAASSSSSKMLHRAASVSCEVAHARLFLIGNYRKLSREISQSPWFIAGKRIGTFSLQEVIANAVIPFFYPSTDAKSTASYAKQQSRQEKYNSMPTRDDHNNNNNDDDDCNDSICHSESSTGYAGSRVKPKMSSDDVFGYGLYKFHSAGREDVDVRMLGTGRPFVLELSSPTREQFGVHDLHAIERAINLSEGGCVEVRQLCVTDSDATVRLARHSESKVKRYRCVVWCGRAIHDPHSDEAFVGTVAVRNLTICQKTPLRVLHRRSLLTRSRVIHAISLTPINAHWFVMDVETQAGTYVKEFVHGDFGRTHPHLGSLLRARTDIIQLDVMNMDIVTSTNSPETSKVAGSVDVMTQDA